MGVDDCETFVMSRECYVRVHEQIAWAWSSDRRHGRWTQGVAEGAMEAASEEGYRPYLSRETDTVTA